MAGLMQRFSLSEGSPLEKFNSKSKQPQFKRATPARVNIFDVQKSENTPGCAAAGCVGTLLGVVMLAVGQMVMVAKLGNYGLPIMIIGGLIIICGLALAAVQGTSSLSGKCPYCNADAKGNVPGFNCQRCDKRIIVIESMFYKDDDVKKEDFHISERSKKEMLPRD
jgi:tRNA(Ile2) C34 agmatinyltransferase TiaS